MHLQFRLREYLVLVWLLIIAGYYFSDYGKNFFEPVLMLVFLGLISGVYAVYRILERVGLLQKIKSVRCTLSLVQIVVISFIVVLTFVLILLSSIYNPEGAPLYSIYAAVFENIFLIFMIYALFTVSFYVLGRKIIQIFHLTFNKGVEEVLYSIAFGVGVTIFYYYVLSLLHLITPWSLVPYFGVAAYLIFRIRAEILKSIIGKFFSFKLSLNIREYSVQKTFTILAILIFLTVAFVSVAGFHPLGGDDMRTYYNVPKVFIEQGGIASFTNEPFNNGPLGFAYLYIPFMLISDHFINFIVVYFFILSLLALFYVGRRLIGERGALLSVLIFFSIPWTLWFLVTAKSEFLLTFILILSIGALTHLLSDRNKQWFAIAGSLFALAVVIKYTVLLLLPALLLIMLLPWRKQPYSLKNALVGMIIFSVVSILVFAPWGIRNYVTQGDVIYPYSESVQRLARGSGIAVNDFYNRFYEAASTRRHVIGPSHPWWLNIWYLATNNTNYTFNKIGPLFFGLLPLMFFIKPRKESRSSIIFLSTIIFITASLWLYIVTRQVWYIIYIFPLWSVLIAYYMNALSSRYVRVMIMAILILTVATRLDTSRLFFVQFFSNQFTLRDYRLPLEPGLSLSDYLNDVIGAQDADYIVFPMGQSRDALISENNKHLYSNYFLTSWVKIVGEEQTDETIRKTFREQGITHVFYINSDMINFREIWCPNDEQSEACNDFDYVSGRFDQFAKGLKVVHRTDDWIVFRL